VSQHLTTITVKNWGLRLASLNTQTWIFVMVLSTGLKIKFKVPEWTFPDRLLGFSSGKIVHAIARTAFVG